MQVAEGQMEARYELKPPLLQGGRKGRQVAGGMRPKIISRRPTRSLNSKFCGAINPVAWP